MSLCCWRRNVDILLKCLITAVALRYAGMAPSFGKPKSRHFYRRAVVHDDVEAGFAGGSGGFVVDDAQLHPDGLGAEADGVFDRGGGVG